MCIRDSLKAVGNLLELAPDLNGKICFGKFVPYNNINVSCLVSIGDKDLAMMLIKDIDTLYVEDIAQKVFERAQKIKKNEDKEHKQRTDSAQFLPSFMVQVMLNVAHFATVTLGINLPQFGLQRHSFGGAMVTSIAGFGITNATAPLIKFSGAPAVVTVNSPEKKAVYKDNQIQIANIVNINFNVDHRFMDAGRTVKMQKAFFDVFENPQRYFKLTNKDNSKPSYTSCLLYTSPSPRDS
eukprot:TRINITY_DN4861_c0_g1_i3.p1 TRINITY_DN4861_c0_g1~~TRINITY_DN4861_c0_g1_i3.p1  ORF type:complete len:239 (+),score=39.40 TRINITY_DN4861_c0_g1_i3:62-778(+)